MLRRIAFLSEIQRISIMNSKTVLLSIAFLTSTSLISHAALAWAAGAPGRGWPIDGIGGGPETDFLQENGVINALPGAATSGITSGSSDNDYYFAGTYSTALPGNVAVYGSYSPIGTVATDETGAERAYAGGDLDIRYHFNLAGSFGANDMAVISFEANNLHDVGAGTRFGIELWMNGVKVRDEQVITAAALNTTWSSAPFTLGSVGAVTGAGADNIVSLRGISYNGAVPDGGNWMGIDYVSLDITPVPEPGSSALMIAVLLGGTSLFRRRRPTA